MIVADGHGGIVLIVPNESGEWEKSLSPFPYKLTKPDTHLPDAIRAQLREESENMNDSFELEKSNVTADVKSRIINRVMLTHADVLKEVRTVASLAAVDGAIVMTRELRVVGFGATIIVNESKAPNVFIESFEKKSQRIKPALLKETGGTRHQSATRFVNMYKDTIALIVSQDQHLAVVHWDARQQRLIFTKSVDWFL